MSDFLTNLAARSIGATAPLQPRLPGRFEPAADTHDEQPDLQYEAGNSVVGETAAILPAGMHAGDATRIARAVANGNSAASQAHSPPLTSHANKQPNAVPTPAFQGRLEPPAPNSMPRAEIHPGAPTHSAAFADARIDRVQAHAPDVPASAVRTASSATAKASVDRAETAQHRPVIEPAGAAIPPMPAASELTSRSQPHRAEARVERATTIRFGTPEPALPSIEPNLPLWLPEQPATLPASPPAPTIHVTIGRIEVRASAQSAPTPRPAARPHVQTLDEYLRHRRGTS